MEFSQIILNYMELHDISGYKLAKATGISESLFGKWRAKPTSKIDTSNIAKIANYFNVSMDELLGNEQKNKPLVNNDEELTKYLEVLKTRPEMKMLFNLAAGATKEDVEKAVKIVEAYLKKD